MANYISENDIEKACVEVLINELGYDEHLNLWRLPDDGNRAFGRADASEVVRVEQLRATLTKLNPHAAADSINAAITELTQSRLHLSPFEINRAPIKLLREGFDVPKRNASGETINERVRFMERLGREYAKSDAARELYRVHRHAAA